MSTIQGSTANISPTRNRPRRVAMQFRPWTKTQWLLNKFNITNRDIAEQSGVALSVVSRSLSVRFVHKTNFGSVSKVRWAVEQLLLQHDESIDIVELWDQYDAELYKEED